MSEREAWFSCQCGWRSPSFDYYGEDVLGDPAVFDARREQEGRFWVEQCQPHVATSDGFHHPFLDSDSPGSVLARKERDARDARRRADAEQEAATVPPQAWEGFDLDYGNRAHYCRICTSAMGAVRSPSGRILCKHCFRSVYKIQHAVKVEGCSCCENWSLLKVDVAKLIADQPT